MGLLSLTMKCRVYFWQSNKRCALLTTNMTQQYGRHLVYSPVCLSYVILYQPRRVGTGFTCIMQRTLVMSLNNPDSSSDLNWSNTLQNSNSIHSGMQTCSSSNRASGWGRKAIQVTLNGRWCQMSWSEYFINCWSREILQRLVQKWENIKWGAVFWVHFSGLCFVDVRGLNGQTALSW